MMNQKITAAIGVALIIGVGGFVYFQVSSAQEKKMLNEVTQQKPPVQQGAFTLTDIARHNDTTSCWSAINGGVYDLTSWIPRHPGGEAAIVSICGIDGSDRFNAQHGGSPLQAKILIGFKIGTLTQ